MHPREDGRPGGGPRRWAGARKGLLAALAAALLTTAPAAAQEAETEARLDSLEARVAELQERLTATDTTGVEELRRRLEAVLRQIEQMRLGEEVVRADTTGLYGLAPAASKVYRVDRGVSIGGYGEILYENFASEREDGSPAGAEDQIDALRGIVYVGYKFSDELLFNSEIEVEHATTSGGTGSVSLEFAYLDYMLSEDVGVRAGLVLPPMGFVNELHEPPTFLGTERPLTESVIIPSTWRENGIGVFGASGDVEYRAYLINSFDAVGDGSSPAGGFSAGGLRGGRQKGGKAAAEDLAGVGRIDWKGLPGLTLGTSLFLGETAQDAPNPLAAETGDPEIGARTLIWEGHAQYKARGTGSESIGERLVGGYVQAGYDVLRRVRTEHQLLPYVRLEKVNTQDEVPTGFSADPANEQTVVSLGAAWKPVPGAILKADYQLRSNEAETGVDQFNVAVGYLF